jgi:hypothetical protein
MSALHTPANAARHPSAALALATWLRCISLWSALVARASAAPCHLLVQLGPCSQRKIARHVPRWSTGASRGELPTCPPQGVRGQGQKKILWRADARTPKPFRPRSLRALRPARSPSRGGLPRPPAPPARVPRGGSSCAPSLGANERQFLPFIAPQQHGCI